MTVEIDLTNPLETPEAYDHLVLGGVTFTGAIEWSGGDLIERRADVPASGGRDGSRIVDRGYKAVDGLELTLRLWEPAHFEELRQLVAVCFPRTGDAARRGALACAHPLLDLAGITHLYPKSMGMLRQVAPTLWETSLRFVEYNAAANAARRTNVTRRVQSRPDIAGNATAFTGLEATPAAPTPPSQTTATAPD